MPIVCDMSTAPDTGPQRLAEYDRLFTNHLLGRERRGEGIRFRLRADAGVEPWVRDLAAREKACCAFLDSQIAAEGGQVLWDISTIDDDIARAILDEYYDLPDSAGAEADELERRLSAKGLQFIGTQAGRTATQNASGKLIVEWPGPEAHAVRLRPDCRVQQRHGHHSRSRTGVPR